MTSALLLRRLLLVILLSVHTRGQEGSGDSPLDLSPSASLTATCSLTGSSALESGSGSGGYLQPDVSALASIYLCDDMTDQSTLQFTVVTSSVDFDGASGDASTFSLTSLPFDTQLVDSSFLSSSSTTKSVTPSSLAQTIVLSPSSSQSLITASPTLQTSPPFSFTFQSAVVPSDVVLTGSTFADSKTSTLLMGESAQFPSTLLAASSGSVLPSDTVSFFSGESVFSDTSSTILSISSSQTISFPFPLSPSPTSSPTQDISIVLSPSSLSLTILAASTSMSLSFSSMQSFSSTSFLSLSSLSSQPSFSSMQSLSSTPFLSLSSFSSQLFQSPSSLPLSLTSSGLESFLPVDSLSSPVMSMQGTSFTLTSSLLLLSSSQTLSIPPPSTTTVILKPSSFEDIPESSTFLSPTSSSSMELSSQFTPTTATNIATTPSSLVSALKTFLSPSLSSTSAPSSSLQLDLTPSTPMPSQDSSFGFSTVVSVSPTLDFTTSHIQSSSVSSSQGTSLFSLSLVPTLTSTSSASLPLPTPTSPGLIEIRLILTEIEHAQLQNSTSPERADLEAALVFEYRRALSQLGARNKRQAATAIAKVTEVGSRGASGETPVLFYISVGAQPIDSSLVVSILGSLDLQEVDGYQVVAVRAYSAIASSSRVSILATSSMPVVAAVIPLAGIVGGTVAVGVVLLIVIVLLTGCLVITVHRKRNKDIVQNIDPQNVESVSTDKESVAIQHGTPAIDKLTRRARQRHQQALSSLAALASSSFSQLDAWQNHQLEKQVEEPPAALFEHVVHYSDVHPSPGVNRPFRAKIRSSSVVPSPAISRKSRGSNSVEHIPRASGSEEPDQQSQASQFQGPPHPTHLARLDTDDSEVSQQKQVALERLKLQSQQPRGSSRKKRRQHQSQQMDTFLLPPLIPPQKQQASKGGESEGEAALGDAEASSRSDEAPAPQLAPPRPATRRRLARRKLASRGHSHSILAGGDTDGYEVTDHHYVPPSRQSRKHRLGRNLRARPFTQQLSIGSRRSSQAATFDAQQELAWMSTGDGVQLISIQPVEAVCMPPPTLQPPTLQRPWQPLPRLPTNGQSQTYSRQQLEQLLQIHRELEHVEQGILHQKVNETPDSSSLTLHRLGDHPHELPMESSYSTEELAGHVFTPSGQFSQPVLLNNPATATWHPVTGSSQNTQPYGINTANQLVWAPHSNHPQTVQSQPMAPVQLTQMRATRPTYLYGQDSHLTNNVW